jgi:hypothetical protein
VSAEDFAPLPGAADLGVALRDPSAGETSAAAIRFFACGTPVAVTGIRQFLEWPPEAAPRVTPGPSACADLVRLLVEAVDRERWSARRRAARAAYEAGHLPSVAARQLIDALRRGCREGELNHRSRSGFGSGFRLRSQLPASPSVTP